MKYQSIKAVTTFMIVAILSSLLTSVATATHESAELNTSQPSISATTGSWSLAEPFQGPVGGAAVVNYGLFDSLQSLIDQVPTFENTNGTECPDVDLAKARALAVELERAYALLNVYKHWTQTAEDNARRAGNPVVEKMYHDATTLVTARRERVERTQKGLFKLLAGLMYPEPYPVRISGSSNVAPSQAILQLDAAEMKPLIISLQKALQDFKVGPSIKSQLMTAKTTFQPGEMMQVKFTASACLAQDAWAGIVPSKTPHGDEEVNDQSKVGQKQFIARQKTGTVSFTVPNEPGSYDVRLNDSNRNGKEVASVTFRVEGSAVSGTSLRTLPNLKSVVVYEQTFGAEALTYAPNAPQLISRRRGPLSDTNKDFSFYPDENYDVFYSNGDGSFNVDGEFITIEGVWRQEGVTDLGGGMNINEVALIFEGANTRVQYGDFVSSFVMGSICQPGMDNHCIPNSARLAADRDLSTFPRFGQTSNANLNQRFRLTIGFKQLR